MAIKQTDFANFTPASAPQTPYGSFKNETTPGAEDGTEFIKDWPNDIFGFLQKLLAVGNVVPTGTPDDADASQYYEALINHLGTNQSQNLLRNASSRGHVAYTNDTYNTPVDDATPIWDHWVGVAAVDQDLQANAPQDGLPALDDYRIIRRVFNVLGSNKYGFYQLISEMDSSVLVGNKVSASIKFATLGTINVKVGIVEWTGAGVPPGDIVSSWNGAGVDPTLTAGFSFLNTPSVLSPSGVEEFKIEDLSVSTSAKRVGIFVWTDNLPSSATQINMYSAQINLGSAATEPPNKLESLSVLPNTPRHQLQWGSASTIDIYGDKFAMGGFRVRGRYLNTYGSVMRTSDANVNTGTDLDSMMTALDNNSWYAIFMAADANDLQCKPIIVPFIRVIDVSGTKTFCQASEGQTKSGLVLTARNIAINGIQDNDVLVISRDAGGAGFSYDVTKCTANTSTTITLADESNMTDGEWLLPAPSDYEKYAYIGAFYVDGSGNIRRFFDDGDTIRYRGADDASSSSTSGAISLETREVSGYVSPLASSVILESRGSVSALAGEGDYQENYYASINSSNHIVSKMFYKQTTNQFDFLEPDFILPFLNMQVYGYETASVAGIDAQRGDSYQKVTGYVEM